MGSEKHRRADHVRNEFRGKIGHGNLDKRKLLSTTLTLLNAIAWQQHSGVTTPMSRATKMRSRG